MAAAAARSLSTLRGPAALNNNRGVSIVKRASRKIQARSLPGGYGRFQFSPDDLRATSTDTDTDTSTSTSTSTNRTVMARATGADAARDTKAPSRGMGGRDVLKILIESEVIDPVGGSSVPAVTNEDLTGTLVVVVVPQLGDFDSAEYCEQLAAVLGDLTAARVRLRVVGIGEAVAARRFSDFTGLPLDVIRLDPAAAIHQALSLHSGPGWQLPEQTPAKKKAEAWLNYMAMCAGIGSPGTLREILRGYLGDRSAPERLRPDALVTAGPVKVMGTSKWGVGPVEANLWWKDESGYQRPVELATVRLKVMVEVLGKWSEYVTNAAHLAQRGGTFVFEDSELVYSWRDCGVLTYSETMPRPLTFLEPYVGPKALNPLGLGDITSAADASP